MRTGSLLLRTAVLAIAGGAAFWLANLLISLTPIAAEYRTALSISYGAMLIEAIVGGLFVGLVVGYGLLRFGDRIPTGESMSKAALLALITMVVATLVVEVPAKFLSTTGDSVHLFLIALAFNSVRFLALGLAIGYVHDRLYGSSGPWRQVQ